MIEESVGGNMKNKILMILVIICSMFFINSINTNAALRKEQSNFHNEEIKLLAFKEGCPIFGDGVAVKEITDYEYTVDSAGNITDVKKTTRDVPKPRHYINLALSIVRYSGIVLFVVLTTADIIKVIISGEKDMYKEVARKIYLRLAYAIALFFVPTIVRFIITVVTGYKDCL